MPTLSEFMQSKDFDSLRRLDRAEFRYLWVNDYWDGPLSGMLLFDGQQYRFQIPPGYDPVADPPGRPFLVIQLTKAQLAEELLWHDLFEKHVGGHWTFDEMGGRGTVKPADTHHKFYEPYKKRTPPNYDGNQVIAWFAV